MTHPAPPGWFPDPQNAGQERFWDGVAWTPQARPIAPSFPPVARPSGSVLPTANPRGFDLTTWMREHPVITALVGAVVVLIVIGAIANGRSNGSKILNSAADTSASDSPVPPVAIVPVTVLSTSGNGEGQTQEFTVADEWSIDYTFDCSDFGQAGNFAMDVEGTDGEPSLTNQGANSLALSGGTTVYNHHGGTYYLSIDSECNWTIAVTSG